mmetsp:Transcript_40415/g.114446  ORF Transcript_40415/g.114446 Transcript_40415/m.114446 type:complete len:341 (+) Transcript_40415:170-1192(+)
MAWQTPDHAPLLQMAAPPQVEMAPANSTVAPYTGPIDANPLIDSHTAQMLGSMVGITVRQKVSWIEGMTQGVCEVRNKYTLHPGAGHEALTHPPFMSAMERSPGCGRCFCAPYHNVFVEFKHSQDPLAEAPIAFTFERQGVCSKCPCCFNCMECCLDSMNMHAGQLTEDPKQAGALSDYSKVIGSAKQPLGCCTCTPTLDIFDGSVPDKNPPISKMHGPCIFGGCSELCAESEFPISRPSSGINVGDVAVIRKLRPRTCGDTCAECCTDSDRYMIEFKDKSLTPQQKATLLGTLMLTDFMMFEQDNGMVNCRDKRLTITFFLCFCGGCLCPCQCILQSNS